MVQLVSALAVAFLTIFVGPLLRGELDGRLARRLKAHVEIRAKVGDESAAASHLDELLEAESVRLRDRELVRLTRKLNGANLAAVIFVAVIGGAAIYGLVTAALGLAGSIWAFVLWAATAIVAFLVIGLTSVGSLQLYAPSKTSDKSTSEG